jgi:surfeit locus 1 family protein
MTSEWPRFPIGLTLAATIVFAICCGLGVWQLQRAAWKAGELRRIAALKNAPPQPIGPLLARAARGENVTLKRVAADCAPGEAWTAYTFTTDNSDWIARALSGCRVSVEPYDGVVIDRGFLAASRGMTALPRANLPAPAHVIGTLYPLGDAPPVGLDHPAPVKLVVESETPAPPGVTPAAYPDAAGNLEYVGSYAPTWFGLAGVALCFYAAMLWRRYHPKR